MKKVIIKENEKGLLFKNGRFENVLECGKHYIFGDRKVICQSVDERVDTNYMSLNAMLKNEKFRSMVTVVDVEDNKKALRFTDGKFKGISSTGKYAFWNDAGKHEFKIVDVSSPEIAADIPEYIFALIPSQVTRVEVKEYEKARLYFDKKFVRLLDAGVHYFWKNAVKIDISCVDTRLIEKNITGQEILSLDKVALRINCVCSYRIVDAVKIAAEIDNYEEQLHTAVQMALRDFVGKHKLDEILENKEEMGEHVYKKLKEKEKELYVEVSSAGVKDIILPGEIRDIMNTVLIAEKKAQANVIARREEVASTRSLLNTARLMDENETLYKLKELEYMEKICENVGNINLSGNDNIIMQLSKLFGKGA